MKAWLWRVRFYGLTLASGSLFLLGGCGLSDQQLASIWQSVITAGLQTIVSNAITTAAGA
jgi:hypothetical protein